ncbi:MAG: tail fiber protein [Chitinophagaceae bacterium]|nr:tail fiber protein [Chitinophagaceae bacterium]
MPAQLFRSGVPFGTIFQFAGEKNQIPQGWLACEGQELSRLTFPLLFEAIGTAWGGTGTPNFFIPDLRGMFLRGVSGDLSTDPNKDDRDSPRKFLPGANPGNSGNNVGSVQADQIREHTHPIDNGCTDDNIGATMRGGIFARSKGTGNTNLAGGKETRPVNAYIYFIIKASSD